MWCVGRIFHVTGWLSSEMAKPVKSIAVFDCLMKAGTLCWSRWALCKVAVSLCALHKEHVRLGGGPCADTGMLSIMSFCFQGNPSRTYKFYQSDLDIHPTLLRRPTSSGDVRGPIGSPDHTTLLLSSDRKSDNKMPGIYLSDPPATGTGSRTRPLPDAPAITPINLSDGFQLGMNTCGFTSGSTSRPICTKRVPPPQNPSLTVFHVRADSDVLVRFRVH